MTDRERTVLTLVTTGLSNAENAAESSTPAWRLRRPTSAGSSRNFQARDRAQLVIAAYESGLVTLGPA